MLVHAGHPMRDAFGHVKIYWLTKTSDPSWKQAISHERLIMFVLAAFSELGQDYNVEGNVSRYLNLINTTLGLTQIQTPLQTLFSAILNSHIIFQPINLYASPQVKLPTS